MSYNVLTSVAVIILIGEVNFEVMSVMIMIVNDSLPLSVSYL